GIEGAGHLGAAEAAVVEEAAILAGERDALGGGLVDDVQRQLGEAVDVGLAGPVVAALDGVVEEAVDRVAVVVIVLGGVDTALGGDGVRTPRRVVEGEHLHLVAQLTEGSGRRGAGEAGADDDDLELPLVGGVDEPDRELVALPLVLQRTGRDLGVEDDAHERNPKATAYGGSRKPTHSTAASAVAKARRIPLNRGWLIPMLWNIDQAPWNRWMARTVTASV